MPAGILFIMFHFATKYQTNKSNESLYVKIFKRFYIKLSLKLERHCVRVAGSGP